MSQTCIQAPSLFRTSRPFDPQAPELGQCFFINSCNLEDDIAVEESTQDQSPILRAPRYWRITLQRPHWSACALTHLETI